jgi:hypothetical protein
MNPILVARVVDVDATLLVDCFPAEYSPARYPTFGVRSAPSGIGCSLVCALTTRGDSVRLLSSVAADLPGQLARAGMAERRIDACALRRPSSWLTTEAT